MGADQALRRCVHRAKVHRPAAEVPAGVGGPQRVALLYGHGTTCIMRSEAKLESIPIMAPARRVAGVKGGLDSFDGRDADLGGAGASQGARPGLARGAHLLPTPAEARVKCTLHLSGSVGPPDLAGPLLWASNVHVEGLAAGPRPSEPSTGA